MSGTMSGKERFALRDFRAGDEPALAALAERAYGPYGGQVLRTPEQWRASILGSGSRLDPGSDLAVLSLADGVPVGYAVLGADGVVLELCLDPQLTGERRAVAAAVLIAALEERARGRGWEEIQLELPRLDGRLRDALLAAGYRAEPGPQLALDLVDVAAALKEILVHRHGRMPHGWQRSFLLTLTPDGDGSRSARRLKVTASGDAFAVEDLDRERDGAQAERADGGGSGGEPAVAITTDPLSTVAITTDRPTLTGLIVRQITFDEAATSGRLALEPVSAEQDVRTLCEFLALKGPWFMPPLDRRQGSTVRSLKLESGLALPFRFTGAAEPGDGAPPPSSEGLAPSRENRRPDAVFHARQVGDRPTARGRAADGRPYSYVAGPGVGMRFCRILGPGALGPRVVSWGERALAERAIRAKLAEPLRVEIESPGLPAFGVLLAVTGFRLEPREDRRADVRLRMPFAWLNGAPPDGATVARAWARGTFRVRARPRSLARFLALALALSRARR
jgi:hypothetical protein